MTDNLRSFWIELNILLVLSMLICSIITILVVTTEKESITPVWLAIELGWFGGIFLGWVVCGKMYTRYRERFGKDRWLDNEPIEKKEA